MNKQSSFLGCVSPQFAFPTDFSPQVSFSRMHLSSQVGHGRRHLQRGKSGKSTEKQILSQKQSQSMKSSTLLPQWEQQSDWEKSSALSSGWVIIRLNAGEWLPNCFQVCKQEKHRSKEKAPPLKHTQAELCAHMPTDRGEKVRARSGEINIYKGRSTQEDKGTMTAIASTTGWQDERLGHTEVKEKGDVVKLQEVKGLP